MKDTYIKQGNLLYELRNKKKMTQYELAKLIGTNYRNISKYELGVTFPDKLKQEKLCEIFNITLEELHQGEINIAKRRKDKITKIFLRIFSVITPILLFGFIALCLTLIYFKENYNPSNIYYLDIEDKASAYCNIDGIYISNRKENIVYIGLIDLLGYNILDSDRIDINFYYENKLIYNSSSLTNLMFKLDSKININDITFSVIIKDFKTDKIKFNNNYKIDTFITKKKNLPTAGIPNIDNNKIIKELKKMGFKKINENEYELIEKSKDNITKVKYIIDSSTLSYEEMTDKLTTTINYNLENFQMDVNIASINNETYTLIENYAYNTKTKIITNKVGNGYSLKDSLKIMDKYISRFKGE